MHWQRAELDNLDEDFSSLDSMVLILISVMSVQQEGLHLCLLNYIGVKPT